MTLYGKTAGNAANVQDKLKLFPELNMYKAEEVSKPVRSVKKKKDRKVEKIFFFIILFLVLVLAAELLFHFVISPKLMIRKVIVRSGPFVTLSDEEVLRLADLQDETFYFTVDTGKIEELLKSYPLIKDAEVLKKFPDSLAIDLTGREPLAMSIVNTDAGAVPVVFDEEGVVFQIGASISDLDRLIVSGIVFKDLQLGMTLPKDILGLLQSLHKLKQEAPELYGLLSEIKIIKRSSNQYETLFYISGYEMPVRMGMSIDKKELKYVLMILDVVTIDDFKKRILELDLRGGEVVYKVKEEVLSGE